jgi:YD repeat-containing protein
VVKHKNFLLSSSIAALLVSGSAGASEIVTYRYDELGRLVASTVGGGPNNAVGTATCFDAAGNRTRHTVGAGVTACGSGSPPPGPPPPSPPPPSPPPSAPPPVAVSDPSVTGPCNSVINYNVVANDYDPNGNTPLTLVSVTSNSHVSAQVISSTTIQFVGTTPGNTSTLSYVIKNSLNATATGSVTYKTTGTTSTCYQ